MRPALALVAVAVAVAVAVSVLLVGCAPQPDPMEEALKYTDVSFTEVTGQIGPNGFYSVGSTATGVTDMDGTHIVFPITISHETMANIYPEATITMEDGRTIKCVETDPRHETNLRSTTTSVELPYEGSMSSSGKGVSVAVVDTDD